MNPHGRDPLTSEERALAQRLSALGRHAGPSPALDARILASARAATTQRPPRRRRTRWPVGVGIAASLAVAIGIAWQLRPLPQDQWIPASESVPVDPAATAPAPAAERASAPATAADDVADAATPAPEPATPRASSPSADPAPRARRATMPTPGAAAETQALTEQAQARDAAPLSEAAPVVFDDPAPMDVAPPSPPAPPPPPPPPAAPTPTPVFVPSPRPATPPADAPSPAPSARAARAPAPASTRAQPADRRLDAVVVSGTRIRRDDASGEDASALPLDQSADDAPPASFTTPESRDAWLQRIRELVQEGELDAARASLHEFRRRHPAHVLPEDLKVLLEE